MPAIVSSQGNGDLKPQCDHTTLEWLTLKRLTIPNWQGYGIAVRCWWKHQIVQLL